MKNLKPEYTQVSDALKTMQALTNASEAHGLLCALFSFGAEVKFTAWSDSLMTKPLEEGDLSAIEALRVMKELYDYTKEQFDEKGLSIDLFLAEDDSPLTHRGRVFNFLDKKVFCPV